jgi:hypothetical protein
MYKPPKSTDLDFLCKKELQMLCFAEYSVYLHFGEGIIITIEGSFEHALAKRGKRPEEYSFPIEASKLMRLVAQRVEHLDARSDGTLRLEFSNGDTLTIRGANGPYEAYQIQHAGGRIVV